MTTLRDLEKQATAKEVPVLQLLEAIEAFAGELQTWLHASDARLKDFDPLDAFARIVSICNAAEMRAEAALRRNAS